VNLTPKHNPADFNRFLFEEIDLNLYQHKFLNDFVDKAKNGQVSFSDLSVINTTDKGWILIIHSEMLLIYGNNWSVEQFQEISEMFDLNKFTNYTLSGDDELIDQLILFYKPKNFEIEKRRLLYQTTKINVFKNENLRIRLGSLNELDELAGMLQTYYHEEYNGLNDKEIEEMKERMFSFIQTEKIYLLLNINDDILSFCSIVDPDIGILFTKNEHRNNGYGKVILSYCSSLLREKNDSVYLMTDSDKIESNIVCETVGFRPYFKYIMTKINCG
jgi:predicted GNAT family acetyltransferase